MKLVLKIITAPIIGIVILLIWTTVIVGGAFTILASGIVHLIDYAWDVK